MVHHWRVLLIGFIILVLGIFHAQGISAATIPINCSSGSLQTAIDSAQAGDTIQVSGTCNENILIRNEKQRLTIDGLGSAIINGVNVNSPTVNLRGKGILIQGFTIKGGQDGVIINRGSNAVINNNLIQNTNGNGIVVQDLSFAVITNNIVTNNPGDGIVIDETGTARIGFNADSDLTPSVNTIQGNLGRGITVGNRSSARILGNAINSNSQGGIAILRDSNAEVSGNGINGNGSHGILVSENSVLRLVESPEGGIFITANSTAAATLNQGFGVSCQTGSVIEGVIGTLNGTSGVSQLLADCLASVLDQSPIAQADNASAGTNSPLIFSVTGNDSDPDNDPLTVTTFTQGANGTVNCTLSGICTYTPNNNFAGVDSFSYTISDGRGGYTSANATVTVTPPDPSVNAPAIDMSVATTVAKSTEFLYSGSNPVQNGVAPGTIQPTRAAVLRGRVLDRNGNVLPGATVTILNNTQFGQTVSRSNGFYDLAVNGGGLLTLNYSRPGYLPTQRQIDVPWQDYVTVDDVALIPLDTRVTTVTPNASTMQVHQSNTSVDADGSRKATLLFPAGTTATMTLANGSSQPLTNLNVRASEYTVGGNGPMAMPGQLPPTSAYTYAVEYSIDQALAANAPMVTFSQPLPTYVENFIGFPAGTLVPAGYYDRGQGKWIASANGIVIKILSVTGGFADLDVTGDNVADTGAALTNLGITTAERQNLALLYAPGQSLWRVPISHFSPWDYNFPYGPPPNACSPSGCNPGPGPKPGPKPDDKPKGDDPCKKSGSIVECQSQVLGEDFPLVGVPANLHYRSNRVASRGNKVEIVLSGGTVPNSLQAIHLEIRFLGRLISQNFPPTANQTFTYIWDRLDAYGRTLQGSQPVTIRIGYEYNLQYFASAASQSASFASFGLPIGVGGGGGSIVSLPVRTANAPFVVWDSYRSSVGSWDARSIGLGGLTLTNHHTFDVNDDILYQGNGGRGNLAPQNSPVISTVAGMAGACGFATTDPCGDGGPATAARLRAPYVVAAGPDGGIYIGDASMRIRRVAPDGIITTVAGSGNPGCGLNGDISICGDGGPAIQAGFGNIQSLAAGPDGSLFIGDMNRIRRVGPNGIITTITGSSDFSFSGDGGPATQATLSGATGLVVGADGSLYISDINNQRIRRIGPDGIITTVAGNGQVCFTLDACGDGGQATGAKLFDPFGLALGPDGSLFIADSDNHRVRRVGPDGIISTWAGLLGSSPSFSGDGGLATNANFSLIRGLAATPDGSLFIADAAFNLRVRKVGPDGIVTTVTGTGQGGFSGDGGPAAQGLIIQPWGLAVGADGALYIADKDNDRVRRVTGALTNFSATDFSVASVDGTQLYQFNGSGRHLRTYDTFTGTILYQFNYDSNGRLTGFTDRNNQLTSVERNGNGDATAIVASGGQRTNLAINAAGYLATITNPAGESVQLSYYTGNGDGLLATLTDARNHVHHFTYDADGRLNSDQDPTPSTITLTRNLTTTDLVTHTSAMGRVNTYKTEDLPTSGVRQTSVDASGAQSVTDIGTDSSHQITYADGLTATTLQGPDPRFGMQAAFTKSLSLATPGGLKSALTVTRTATLQDPANLLSLTALSSSATLNGQTFTSNYDGVARTLTTTTPTGRQIFLALDAKGRGIQERLHPSLTPVNYTYDGQGRVTQVQQGTLGLIYGYDAKNRVISRTDGTGAQTLYTYDAADRLASTTLPSGRTYFFSYDANGNRTQIAMPNSAVHLTTYNTIDLETVYTPPGNSPYQTAYNLDAATNSVTLPSARVLSSSYDAGGRFTAMTYPEAAVAFQYFGVTNRPSLITRTTTGGSPVQQMALTYDANLVTSFSWNGPANGSYQYRRNNDFSVVGITLNANPETLLTRDNDGLIINHGTFSITRAGPTGAQSLIGDGALALTLGYDSLGRQNNRAFNVAGSAIYQNQLSFDNVTRVSQRVETLSGVSHTFDYSYDLDGQLTQVKRDGATVELYGYDLNGNRNSSKLGAAAIVASTFDNQDRLQQRGAVNYQFDTDGFLAQRGTDTFQYSARGELLQANVGAQTINYAYDGLRRRVARTDTAGTYQYLYGSLSDPFQVTAMRDPSNVLSEYFYDDNDRLYAIHRGASWYYVASDQVGTPRVVTDNTGAIQKIIEYDTFGNKTTDSNPAFDLPIGFAGGLEDPATQLVRFGLRDFEPQSGRWTARDPLFFDGNQLNLYAYVGNYPVGLRDPSGLESVDCLIWNLANQKDYISPQQRARKARDEFFAKNGEHDANLRDADHFLFSREYARNNGFLGSLAMTAFTPYYTGAKFWCLTCVETAYKLLGEDPSTSQASLGEIYWGVRGAWDSSLDEGSSPPPDCCKN